MSHHSSIYSASLLSYFYSADSDSSDTSELIYHEASSSRRSTPSPIPPPPLPKRNSNQSNQLSVIYLDGPDHAPQLLIAMPPSPESRRTSLGQVTHEVHQRRCLATPQSEEDSLVLESKQYVQDIRDRRDNIHATLLRGTAPGDRIRRMFGYRLEQRLVKVSQGFRKGRTNTKKRPKKKHKPTVRLKIPPPKLHHSRTTMSKFQRYISRPPGLIRKLSKSIGLTKPKPRSYVLGANYNPDEEMPSDIEQLSQHSSPRFIVDRQGTFHWPPISQAIGDDDDATSANLPSTLALSPADNFTLARPRNTNSSEVGPSVLGWLQVNTDSHVFTPALASPQDAKDGPFKKAPFHANMHVLKTKI